MNKGLARKRLQCHNIGGCEFHKSKDRNRKINRILKININLIATNGGIIHD